MKNILCAVLIFAAGPLSAATAKSESSFLAAAKNAVKSGMKDSSSVQFRNLILSTDEAGVEKYLCGEVNAKNSYGGYVGFRQFFVGSDGRVTVRDDEHASPSDFSTFYPQYCAQKVKTIR